MALADLLVKINGDIAGLKTALGEANTTLAAFGKKQEGAARTTAAAAARQASIFEGSLRSFSTTATRVGSQLTLGFSLPMTLAGGAALKAAGEMEQANIAFKTMLGSAEKAKAMLTDLQQFALRTPFEFRDLQDAAKRLMALGFAAKDIIPVLTSVGDAVAALGGGKEMIDRVTIALGQMKAKGTIQAEEMRQLAEAGIPAWDILAKKLGVDIPTAMAMVEKRAVQSAEAIPAILAGMNEKFSGLMEMQSRTLLGQWSNLKDKLYMTAVEIGNNLMPIGKAALESLNPALAKVKELTEKFSELPDATKTAALGIGAVAVATPAAVWGLGLISGSLANIIGFAKSGAFGLWTTVVVGGLMQVALAAASAYINFKSVQDEWRAIRGQYPDLDKTLAGNASDMAARARARIESGIKLETSALFANQKGASGGISDEEWKALNDAYKASHLPFDERSTEANQLARNVQEAWKWEQMLRLEFEAFGADVPELTAKIDDYSKAWEPTLQNMGKVPNQVEEIEAAFKRQGITSSFELNRFAEQAQKDYELIRDSGLFSAEEVEKFWVKAGRAQAEAALAAGDITRKEYDSIVKKLDEVGGKATATVKHVESGMQKFGRQVSTVITDLSRDLADLAFQGGKFKDVMVNAAESFGKAIFRAAIEAQLQRILGLFKNLISEGGTLGKIMGAVFGGGSSAASNATKTASSAGGSVAGGASSAAGSAVGGIANIVTGAISAGANVVSAIYNIRQEGTLNAIEHNTRYAMMYLGERADGGIIAQVFRLADAVDNSFAFLSTVVKEYLKQIRDATLGFVGVSVNVSGEQATDLLNALLQRAQTSEYTAGEAISDQSNILLNIKSVLTSGFRDVLARISTYGELITGQLRGLQKSTLEKVLGFSSAGLFTGGNAASGAGSALGGIAMAAMGPLGMLINGLFGGGNSSDTGRIEENTRFTYLLLNTVVENQNKWLPASSGILSYLWDVQAKYLQMICAGVESLDAKAMSGGTQNITINISGAGDPKSVAEQVIKALKMQSTVAAYA